MKLSTGLNSFCDVTFSASMVLFDLVLYPRSENCKRMTRQNSRSVAIHTISSISITFYCVATVYQQSFKLISYNKMNQNVKNL